jgi:hypothetical protein
VYSFVDVRLKCQYNTVIDLNIPYTLHVPNDEYKLVFPEDCIVRTKKVWTSITNDNSDKFDAISEKPLYYQKFDATSASVPFNPQD